ncbi:MAG: hypothetical protein ACXWNR_09220, partial [Candidatus Limnocylindrales bacterium]
PEEIRKQIKLITVDNMEQVLEAALRHKPTPLAAEPGKPEGGKKPEAEGHVRVGFPPAPGDQPPAMA